MKNIYFVYSDNLEIKELEVLDTTSYGVVYTNENGMQRQISHGELNKGRYFDSLKAAQKKVIKELMQRRNTSRQQLIQSEIKLAEFLYSIRTEDTPFEDILCLIQYDTDTNKMLEEIFNDPINS